MTVQPNNDPATPSPDSGGGSQQPQRELVLARWGTRFWAWLVDFIIVAAAFEIIFAIVYPPLAYSQGFSSASEFMGGNTTPWIGGVKFAVQSSMFFAYWIYFESGTGQSIGKRLLKIKTTNLEGNRPEIKNVAIESFGKAFLLPIDVLLGWIFTNDKRQRLLARAASTIVIKYDDSSIMSDITYRKE